MLGILGIILLLCGFILMVFPSLEARLTFIRPVLPRSTALSSPLAIPEKGPSLPLETETSFADPNLEATVRRAIAISTGVIESSDLVELLSLDVSQCRITSLEGIQQCANLIELDLSGNHVTNLAPLAELARLEVLDLSDNGIEDSANLNAISACGNLRLLSLSANEIIDITPLANLENLSVLDLSGNKIVDASSLLENRGLGRGDSIDLRFNPMDLGEGSANRTTIRSLEARGAMVTPSGDVRIIAFEDQGLERAVRNAAGQWEGQLLEDNVQHVSELAAASHGIVDLEGLQYLHQLQRINVSWNEIVDCSLLTQLQHVYELNLKGNNVVDVAPIVAIPSLSSLDLSENRIANIDVVWKSHGLLVLALARNEIKTIDAISDLKGLRLLDVSGNQIVDISAIRGFLFLDHLVLSDNQITDITVLSGLSALRNVELANNQVADISPLLKCVGLRGAAAVVDLRGNPLDLNPGSETLGHVEALQARGVDVRF